MAFAIDRVEAAKRLSISTRTVDRHIQAGRIRTKRIGKKIFLNEEDVEAIRANDPGKNDEEYIIIEDADAKDQDQEIISRKKKEVSTLVPSSGPNYIQLYETAQKIIIKKDEVIQDLAYRLGKSEAELKNSIPLTEYKKATFLLESAKSKTDADAVMLSGKINQLEKELVKRNSMVVGLAILFVFVLCFSAVVFLYTQFR